MPLPRARVTTGGLRNSKSVGRPCSSRADCARFTTRDCTLPAILSMRRMDYFPLERYSKWCMEFVPPWTFRYPYPRLNDVILRRSLASFSDISIHGRITKSLAIPYELANSPTNSEIILPGWKISFSNIIRFCCRGETSRE